MTTISNAIERLDPSSKHHNGPNNHNDVDQRREDFEATKQAGKLVMFEGGASNPSLLINCENRHVSVSLSRREIAGLAVHFIQILEQPNDPA